MTKKKIPRPTAEQVKKYLTDTHRIDEDVVGFFISGGDIYEGAAYRNAVFVGRNANLLYSSVQ